MIDDELKQWIDGAIVDGNNLDAVLKKLREFKLNGGKQQDALETLQTMREDASEEYEDRVLEIMDFASGFCPPEKRIWQ